MSSILRRLILLVKVWARGLLASAEDPREVFAAAYQRQRELLENVLLAKARIATSRHQLEAKAAEARVKPQQLEEQARKAVAAGREDQARFAIQMRLVAVEQVEDLEEQILEMERQEQGLALVEQRLTTQIQAFFARQEVLAARYSTAEAQVRINEALTGVSEELTDLGLAIERTEQRTEDMQARISAIDQLVDLGILEMPGRSQPELPALAQATSETALAVEEQLAALRRQVKTG